MTNDRLRLKALQVFNWGYTPFTHPLPIGDKLTVLYGANGSGKTTYLNAIMVLLGIENLPRNFGSFDRFVREGSDWAFLRAIVDNRPDAKTHRRPFQGLFPAIDYDEYTLACVLDKRTGTWKRDYYIHPGDNFIPQPDKLPHKDYIFTGKSYREMLSRVGVSQALLQLLNVGVDGVTTEMRDARSLFNFFFKLIGNEAIRTQYTTARKNWSDHRDEADRLELQYQRNIKTLDILREQVEHQRKRRQLEKQILQNQIFLPYAQIRDWQKKLEVAQEQNQIYQEDKKNLQIKLNDAEGLYLLIQERQQEIQEKYELWRKNRDVTEQQKEQASKIYTQLETQYRQLETYVDAIRIRSQEVGDNLVDQIEMLQSDYEYLLIEIQNLQNELKNVEQEQSILEKGKISLPSRVMDFANKLNNMQIPYIRIADVVNIIDPHWRNAVEGILGSERYTIVIGNDRDYLQAKQLAERERYAYWISPPNLQPSRKPVQDSLWEVVEVEDKQVIGYVADLLMSVRRVKSVEEGHHLIQQTSIITVTAEAYRQERRGGRSVAPDHLICGASARVLRLEQLKQIIPEVKKQLISAQESKKGIEKQLNDNKRLLDAIQQLPEKENELLNLMQSLEESEQQLNKITEQYMNLKRDEDVQNQDRNYITQQMEKIIGEKDLARKNLEQLEGQIRNLGIDRLEGEIRAAKQKVEALPDELERIFNQDTIPYEEYQKHISDDLQSLENVPSVEPPVNEDLFRQQLADHDKLGQELNLAKQRWFEARELLEKARENYEQEVRSVFNQRMAAEFKILCRSIQATGHLEAQTGGGDFDEWSLEVRIGFNNKRITSLSQAYLSRGQSVLTSLFLVLAALRSIGAAPILILDELMSLLDEANAPLVLESLRSTEAQCFVATPQSRAGLEDHADILWGFQQKLEDQENASPVAVVTRAL